MASSKDRQRKLARAKLDRQLARRAAGSAAGGRSRPGVGAGARGAPDRGRCGLAGRRVRHDEPADARRPTTSARGPRRTRAANTDLKDVGTPPTKDMPTLGHPADDDHHQPGCADRRRARPGRTSPCGAASLDVPGAQEFYDNTDVPRDHRRGRAALRRPERHRPAAARRTRSTTRTCRRRPTPRRAPRRRPAQPPTLPQGHRRADQQPAGRQRQPVPDLLQGLHAEGRRRSTRSSARSPAAWTRSTRSARSPPCDNSNGDKVKPKTTIVIQSLTVGEPVPPRRPPSGAVGRASAPASPEPATDVAAYVDPAGIQEEHRVVDQGPAARGGAGPAREGDGRAGRAGPQAPAAAGRHRLGARGRRDRRRRVWIVAGARQATTTRRRPHAPRPARRHRRLHLDPEDRPQPARHRSRTSARPPPNAPNAGTQTMTIDTNLGAIRSTWTWPRRPCTAASFTYLASKKFWDNTKCHRLITEGIKVLQCGDPSRPARATARPTAPAARATASPRRTCRPTRSPPYPKGTIAMAKTRQPGSTGSQFFIVYEDTAAAARLHGARHGHQGPGHRRGGGQGRRRRRVDPAPGDGHPKKEVASRP